MAAGLGFKTFTTGEVLTAGDVNGYLMQGVLVFADGTARDAAITSPEEGQFAYLKSDNKLYYYTGATWAEADTSGIQPSEFAAKGDLLAGTGSATFDNLTVGANNTVLTADSAEATGLKWAAVPSSGLVYVGGTSFTASSAVNVNDVFSATYQNYKVYFEGVASVAVPQFVMRYRVAGADNTTSNYSYQVFTSTGATNSAGRTSNNNLFQINQIFTNPSINEISIYRPFETATTLFRSSASDNMASSTIGIWESSGIFTATTSFTGFTIYPLSGNITGTVRVYGLANS